MHAAIRSLKLAYPSLPQKYLDFLDSAPLGAEGELACDPGWYVIWPAEEALVATNEYGMPDCLPGYFAFGGNGGGELFVFDLADNDENRTVLMVPAIGMAVDTLCMVAPSFADFLNQFDQTYGQHHTPT